MQTALVDAAGTSPALAREASASPAAAPASPAVPTQLRAVTAGLRGLGPVRLAAMALVALLCLGGLAAVAFRGGTQQMALLYGDLDLREASQVVEQLDRARIPRTLEAGGTRVLVPTDQVARARLLLAKEGLPSGGSVGYEIFDRTDALTASGFQQGINQARALEGELSRTIRGLAGVRAARVHLVLPRREPFQRDRQDAQASVVLTMAGTQRMDREGVQAVLNLVSAAVPGLRPQNVAVVDSRGNVLSRAGEPTGQAAAAQTAEELRRATELRLSRAVEEMLERTLGPGRVRAEAAVEMDLDQVRETQERFDPDGQVVRSQQSSTSTSRTTEQQQNVSVQNNLPNADAGQTPNGSQEQKQDETTNYEISKTVRTLVREHPQIKRMSVAVLVDGAVSRGADGAAQWQERSAEELARLTSLVRSAVGFDERRGDRVEVVSMRFAAPGEEGGAAEAARSFVAGLMDRIDPSRALELGVVGLLGLLALLLVFRPMAVRLSRAVVPDRQAALPAGAGAAGGAVGVVGAIGPNGVAGAIGAVGAGAAMITGPDGQPLLSGPVGESERMLDVARVQGQMRASTMRRIAELVEAHPRESVEILRSWIGEEPA